MNQTPPQHLTDAVFSDLIAGEEPDAVATAHLRTCEHCRTELDEVRSSLAAFSGTSARWAETVAPSRIPVPSRWVRGLSGWPTFATGAAVTALTGILVFNFGPAASTRQGRSPMPAVTVQAPSNTEIADDNRLILSIDQELSYRAQPTVAPSDAHPDTRRGSHRAADSVLD